MTWARLKLVDASGNPLQGKKAGQQAERIFNLAILQWWVGHGDYCELQYPGQSPVYVEIKDKRLEMFTGTSGGYAGK